MAGRAMIPYFDYRPEYRRLETDIAAALRRVLASGSLILGPEVAAFERECAAYLAVPHAVGVASGTDALHLALRALGVESGDEVITVANAGTPPVAAIRAAGAVPRFVDVDDDTLLMDPRGLEQARTERTRCILPVHLYGRPLDLAPIVDFAKRHGLWVVEDCAQAFGAAWNGRKVGGLGDVGCFSFYPTKTLGAYGDGGLCVTRDAALAERLRMLRMYGFRGDRHAHCEGFNSRLDELQAALLRVKLPHLDEALEERRSIARSYRAGLAGAACRLPAELPGGAAHAHAWHLFVVRAADRAALVRALDAADVGHGIHYADAVHRMEAYRFLGYGPGALPVTEAACETVLSLPIYPGLSPGDVERVVRAVRRA